MTRRHESGLRATVSIRGTESLDRHSRHEKGFEHSVLDHLHRLGGNAFVVIFIPAAQIAAAQAMPRGIVGDGEELGENLLVYLLGECLPFPLSALTLSFEAVSEHFMKKHGGSPTR